MTKQLRGCVPLPEWTGMDIITGTHTCDELKRSFREIFLSFQGGF